MNLTLADYAIFSIPVLVIIVMFLLYRAFMKSVPNDIPSCDKCGNNHWDRVEECTHIFECRKCHHRENFNLDDEDQL